MEFVSTTAIAKLLQLKKRIKVIPGGTSAGKTFGILPILIDLATQYPRLEISVVAESIPHLRRGAMKDFEKIMRATNRWVDAHFNKSTRKYTFANNSFIEFFSAGQGDELRGARRNVLYINEANNVNYEAYSQLSIRTSNEIWIDFNPTNEFWAHEHLADDEDAEWLTLTYKDNEALSPAIVKEIEKAKEKAKTSKYWDNWWKVYGLGQLGALEDVIFSNWDLIDTIPAEAKLLGYGMDFGFTNDPTTLIAVYKYNDKIIYDEELYQLGLTNREIANHLKRVGVGRSSLVVADSAEPKSIKEINSYGFSLISATKGQDSINYGITTIQENDFAVTKRSTNLIKELRNYAWDKDKWGNKLNRPIDDYNHAIDAMRYAATKIFGKNTSKYARIRA